MVMIIDDMGLGVKQKIKLEDDGFTFANEQECDPIIELNKAQMNDNPSGQSKEGFGKHVARIPLVLIQELERKGILKDKKEFRKWLNDPDNRFFRTSGGKL